MKTDEALADAARKAVLSMVLVEDHSESNDRDIENQKEKVEPMSSSCNKRPPLSSSKEAMKSHDDEMLMMMNKAAAAGRVPLPGLTTSSVEGTATTLKAVLDLPSQHVPTTTTTATTSSNRPTDQPVPLALPVPTSLAAENVVSYASFGHDEEADSPGMVREDRTREEPRFQEQNEESRVRDTAAAVELTHRAAADGAGPTSLPAGTATSSPNNSSTGSERDSSLHDENNEGPGAHHEETLVEARLVVDNSEQPQNQQLDASAADIIFAEAEPASKKLSQRTAVIVFGLMGIAILGLVIGVVMGRRGGESSDTTVKAETPSLDDSLNSLVPLSEMDDPEPESVLVEFQPTLERVRERGLLRCGVIAETKLAAYFGKLFQEAQNNSLVQNASATSGVDLQESPKFIQHYCDAIAAGIFGDNATAVLVGVTQQNQFQLLSNSSIDVLLSATPVNMKQDVFEPQANDGLSFAAPYYYTGIRFTGMVSEVACADASVESLSSCTGMKICVNKDHVYRKELERILPRSQIVPVNDTVALFTSFLDGNCNVVADPGDRTIGLRLMGYTGDLAVSQKAFSPTRGALISLDRDPKWADFVNVITWALFAAEEMGITAETADQMGPTDLFGTEYQNMLIDAIKANGNFGEIYDLPEPRSGRETVNVGAEGLLASAALGDIDAPSGDLNGRTNNGTIERIIDRGFLDCGVRGGRAGFAIYNESQSKWNGLDVDYCTSLAASLFQGDTSAVRFHDVDNMTAGFSMLFSRTVDVFAGALWTIENDVREEFTKAGYSFSQPYFYAPLNNTRLDENLCLATREDDPQWSAYVYWTSQALVYAEEHDIAKVNSSRMPFVLSFGNSFQRMFRDAVNAVGNHGEVWARNLQGIVSLGGRNMLNLLEREEPLRYIPPGLVSSM